MSDIYLDGDPSVDSTRRHLERVLKQPDRRRWPWFLAMFAGGTAFAVWRGRRRPEAGRSQQASSGRAR